MEKVFVLGLHRSATRSTTLLLMALGYRALHWPWKVGETDVEQAIRGREHDLDHVWNVVKPVTAQFDAFADSPFPVLYERLFEAHPDARFVLMHRSPREWLGSIRMHTRDRPLDPIERTQFWRYLPDRPESLAGIGESWIFAMLWQHLHEVTAFFAERAPGRFIAIGLDESHPGERLQMFLGLPALMPLPRHGQGLEDEQRGCWIAARLAENRGSLEIARRGAEQSPRLPAFQRHYARLLEQSGDAAGPLTFNERAEALEACIRARAEARGTATARRPAPAGA